MDQAAQEKNQLGALVAFIVTAVVGLTAILTYAIQAGSFWSVFGVALTVAGASLLTGALFGFLFGIPRTLQHDRPASPRHNAKDEVQPRDEEQETRYAVNTNLEQISDWLTKILVGVGLTQIGEIPGALGTLAGYLAPGFQGSNVDSAISKVFAIGLFIYALICGFFVGYLWTRLFLAGAFRLADLSGIKRQLDRVEEKVGQSEVNVLALDLVDRQLNPTAEMAPVKQEELNKAVKAASNEVKNTIFYKVQQISNEDNKSKLERTIPILRALIESDPQQRFYRDYALLGHALVNQPRPDWKEAEKVLTTAIEIRGGHGIGEQEFYRAICRIRLDPAFERGRISRPEVRDAIVHDLGAIISVEVFESLRTPDVTKWMEQNSITIDDLGLPGPVANSPT